MGDYCKINKACQYWRNGAGGTECFKCAELNKQAAKYDHSEAFYTDEELISKAQSDGKITSIFTALRHIDHDRRRLFEDHYLAGISYKDIADEHKLTKQQAYRTIRSVRHDIRLLMNLSTVF